MNEKVMVAGHICLDIAPRFSDNLSGKIGDIITPGKLINVGEPVMCTGGAVSNTGLAMAKLGVDVSLNGKVGDDDYGRIIKRLVGVERASSFKTVKGEHTSYTVILAMPGIDRVFLHHTGTNDTFTADDIDYESAATCKLFHFGYPPLMASMYANEGEQLVKMFKRIKELGLTTSLDMSLPDPESQSGQVNWKRILEKVLPYVDIFLPSIDEIAFVLGRAKKTDGNYTIPDYVAISNAVIEMGSKIVVIKSGIDGLYLRTASAEDIAKIGKAKPSDIHQWSQRELWAPTFKVDTFGSATGAGDTTIAGFLCGLIRDFSPAESLRLANMVGAQNVQAIDALGGIENWTRTMEMLEDKSQQNNPVHIKLDGWQCDQKKQVFLGCLDKF